MRLGNSSKKWCYGILFLCILMLSFSLNAVQKLEYLDNPIALSQFELEDDRGDLFGLDQLKGQWSLITIGFTSCPDICPFVLTNLRAVSKKISGMGLQTPRVIFVGIDPYRDRKTLPEYVSHFGANVTGVTGSHSELNKLVSSIGGNYTIEERHSKTSNTYYDVKHTAFVVLVSPFGEVVARLNPPLPVDDTVNFLLNLVDTSVAQNF